MAKEFFLFKDDVPKSTYGFGVRERIWAKVERQASLAPAV